MAKTPTLALVLGFVALGSVITCSPFGGGDFTCTLNTQCTGGSGGVCEASGYCSFADPSCAPSGQRYGDGPSSGACVGGMATIDAPLATPDGSAALDASGVDGPGTDAAPTRFCLGTYVNLCVPTTPTAPVVLPAALDTDSTTTCRTDVTDASGAPITTYCVLAGTSITGGTVATGSRPLVLLASVDMTIATLDVASHRGGTTGAAANATACAPPGTSGTGGGGGGGGFGGKGGDGGNGQQAGGTGGAATPPTALRGGCPGKDGTTANTHGSGGGVVMLAAAVTITITGAINASGASSATAGNTPGAGASGAGSGGMIVLEAPTLANNGVVFANGGSGAEGSSAGGTPGNPGNDPTNATAAPGGANGTQSGGDGGTGGAKPPTNGDGGKGGDGTAPPASPKGGGGGGGGAIGVITTHGGTLGGSVSPTPLTH